MSTTRTVKTPKRCTEGRAFQPAMTGSASPSIAPRDDHTFEDGTLDDQSRDIFLQMVKMLPAFQDKFTRANGYRGRNSELQLRYGLSKRAGREPTSLSVLGVKKKNTGETLTY